MMVWKMIFLYNWVWLFWFQPLIFPGWWRIPSSTKQLIFPEPRWCCEASNVWTTHPQLGISLTTCKFKMDTQKWWALENVIPSKQGYFLGIYVKFRRCISLFSLLKRWRFGKICPHGSFQVILDYSVGNSLDFLMRYLAFALLSYWRFF